MGLISDLINFIMHLDIYVIYAIKNYGPFSYALLFLIIFLETGLVITPFLPGDSLLFLAGTFASKGSLNVLLLFILLILAATLGDTFNYWIGNFFGEKVFLNNRFFKQEYLEKTRKFYQKHGKKTIIMARFVPIVRTFAPFVAGIGKMEYLQFLSFNIIGGIGWVALFLFGGYFFAGIPLIENNLTIVILIIIFASLIPPIIEFIKHRKKTEEIKK